MNPTEIKPAKVDPKALSARESRVMDFINAKNKELQNLADKKALNEDPAMKMAKLQNEYKKGTAICIDSLLGRVYKDALPFDDPKKDMSDDDARVQMHNYISARTDGKDAEYYVREAIKRNNSSTLKNILEWAQSKSKKFLAEKTKDIGKLDLKSLDFTIDNPSDELDKITKKLELDEISEIIHNNVQKALQDETAKAKKEEEYNKNIEDQLANDPNVVDDASMEAALNKMDFVKAPTVYQPSLMEAIMLGKQHTMTESTTDMVVSEAVHEFTKLNITKALKLEKFDLNGIRKLANSYL